MEIKSGHEQGVVAMTQDREQLPIEPGEKTPRIACFDDETVHQRSDHGRDQGGPHSVPHDVADQPPPQPFPEPL